MENFSLLRIYFHVTRLKFPTDARKSTEKFAESIHQTRQVKSRWNHREDVISKTHSAQLHAHTCKRAATIVREAISNPPVPTIPHSLFTIRLRFPWNKRTIFQRVGSRNVAGHTGGDAVEKRARKREGNTGGGLVVCAGRTREQKITERTIWEITEAPVLVSNRLNPAAGRIPCCLSPLPFPGGWLSLFSLAPLVPTPLLPLTERRGRFAFSLLHFAFCHARLARQI